MTIRSASSKTMFSRDRVGGLRVASRSHWTVTSEPGTSAWSNWPTGRSSTNTCRSRSTALRVVRPLAGSRASRKASRVSSRSTVKVSFFALFCAAATGGLPFFMVPRVVILPFR